MARVRKPREITKKSWPLVQVSDDGKITMQLVKGGVIVSIPKMKAKKIGRRLMKCGTYSISVRDR